MDTYRLARRYCHFALAHGLKYYSQVFPNPPVGALIVKNGKIISMGAHKKAGLAHAEVDAINQAGSGARGADIFVSLEPCNHFGKTGPCTQAILQSGIKRVFYLSKDLTKAGGGAKYLIDQGIEAYCVDSAEKPSEYLDAWRNYALYQKVTITPVFLLSLNGGPADLTSSGLRDFFLKRKQFIMNRSTSLLEASSYDMVYLVNDKHDSDHLLGLWTDERVSIEKVILVRVLKYLNRRSEDLLLSQGNLFSDLKLKSAKIHKDWIIEEYKVSHV